MLSDRKRTHVDRKKRAMKENMKTMYNRCDSGPMTATLTTNIKATDHFQFRVSSPCYRRCSTFRFTILFRHMYVPPHIHTPFHTRFGSVRNFETGFQTAVKRCVVTEVVFFLYLLFIFGTQNLIGLFCLPIEKRSLLPFRCSLNRHCLITSTLCDSLRLFTHFAVDQYLPLIRTKHTEFADRRILHS